MSGKVGPMTGGNGRGGDVSGDGPRCGEEGGLGNDAQPSGEGAVRYGRSENIGEEVALSSADVDEGRGKGISGRGGARESASGMREKG